MCYPTRKCHSMPRSAEVEQEAAPASCSAPTPSAKEVVHNLIFSLYMT